MARHANVSWGCPQSADGSLTHEHVAHQILMDIRDELQKLNVNHAALLGIFRCPEFQQIPMVLRAIRANTSKPKKLKSRKAA